MTHAFLILSAISMIYPLLWMLAGSFKSGTIIFRDPSLIPHAPTIANYVAGWQSLGGFGHFFVNSFVIAAVTVLGTLFSCSFAAYAFARLDFAFKRILFAVMLATIMLPFHVTVVPQYIVFSQLGWVNTFVPILLPKWLAVDSFFIFLLVQFIRGIPRELDEAAQLDGCGPIRIYWQIILPLMKPALATAAIFAFIWSWNDFFSPLLYLTDPKVYTVPLGLRGFVASEGESAWGSLFAMSILSLIPIFAVFLYGQKFLVRGISTTGLK
ncbi:carbohydrate ABC transporter permease [Actinopolymorpha pittospori]